MGWALKMESLSTSPPGPSPTGFVGPWCGPGCSSSLEASPARTERRCHLAPGTREMSPRRAQPPAPALRGKEAGTASWCYRRQLRQLVRHHRQGCCPPRWDARRRPLGGAQRGRVAIGCGGRGGAAPPLSGAAAEPGPAPLQQAAAAAERPRRAGQGRAGKGRAGQGQAAGSSAGPSPPPRAG